MDDKELVLLELTARNNEGEGWRGSKPLTRAIAEIRRLRGECKALGKSNHNLVMEIAEMRKVLRDMLATSAWLEGSFSLFHAMAPDVEARARKLLEPVTHD